MNLFRDYDKMPETIDVHTHLEFDKPDDIKAFADVCRKCNTRAILLGGLRYGGHSMVPNERVAEICAENPDAFLFGAKIDLGKKVNPDDVRKYVAMGAVELKFIYPWFAYDDDTYMPLYEEAEKYNIPCIFHTGNYAQSPTDVIERRPILRNQQPITLDRIARSFPNLNIIMAHLGTTFYRQEAAEYAKWYRNIYFDLAGSGAWASISPEELLKMMSFPFPLTRFDGFRKMIFGSDTAEYEPNCLEAAHMYFRVMFERLGLPDDVVDGIYSGTMKKFIAGIKRS